MLLLSVKTSPLKIPPPRPVFPLIVLLLTVKLPTPLKIPPPRLAEFPLIVLLLTVKVPYSL